MQSKVDHKEHLLFHRNMICAHCNHTGESDDTFDRLCPHCTPEHCVICGSISAPIEAGNYRYCREHARQEKREL